MPANRLVTLVNQSSLINESTGQEVPPELRTLWSHFSLKLCPAIATIMMSKNGV